MRTRVADLGPEGQCAKVRVACSRGWVKGSSHFNCNSTRVWRQHRVRLRQSGERCLISTRVQGLADPGALPLCSRQPAQPSRHSPSLQILGLDIIIFLRSKFSTNSGPSRIWSTVGDRMSLALGGYHNWKLMGQVQGGPGRS